MYVTPPISINGLKKGKKYKVYNVDIIDDLAYFYIKPNPNMELFCMLKGCFHLNNLNWKIVEL